MKPTLIEDLIGWIGASMILIAYALNPLGFIIASKPTYILFNLFGAFAVAFFLI